MPRLFGERQANSRRDGQQTGLGRNQKVRAGQCQYVALHHQQKADRSGFDGFVAAEHQPELIFLVGERLHDQPVYIRSAAQQAVGEQRQYGRRDPYVQPVPLLDEPDHRKHHARNRRGDQQQQSQLNNPVRP